jgi:transcriptional regulator with XRE-family HTH domain
MLQHMPDRPTPGQILRQKRQELGETQFQLAARTGIDPGSISRMERDLREIYRPSRVILAAALGIDEDDLKRDEAAPAGVQ